MKQRARAAVLLEAMMGAALLAIGLTALLVPMSTLTHTRVHQRALMGAIGIANEMADTHRNTLLTPTVKNVPGMPPFTVEVRHDNTLPVRRLTVIVDWQEGVMPHNYTMVTHVSR